MYLKSLELSGFKSFAKKAALDFTAPVTSVVGPNGSGKSNVAEAFRFALGEQSMKSMRGKKGEDLIWNGSPALGRANRASVKVTFDNRKRLLAIDFDEVSIERVVHRDGVNEYLINGSVVRLRDVTELLAGAHIGASGHHIISQGEADRILTASVKERRSMIEDALGLKLYHYKRLESERRLVRTEENLEKVESLRRELAPHIKFLKKQVEKVERAFALKQELSTRYKEYFRRENAYFIYERDRIAAARQKPQQELLGLEQEVLRLKQEIAQSERSDTKSHELIALEERLRTTRDAVSQLARESGRMEGAVASEMRRLARLEADAQREGLPVPFFAMEQFATGVGREAEAVIEATDLATAQQKGSQIKEMATHFVDERKVAGNDTEIADSKVEIERVSAEKKEIDARLSQAGIIEAQTREEYARLRSSIEREKDTGREAERRLFSVMARQNELSNELSGLAVFADALSREEEEYKREIAEAVVLAGRDALAYEGAPLTRRDGSVADEAEMATELRSEQVERRRLIEKIKIRLEESGGVGGDDVMKEYQDASERDAFLAREIEDLQKTAVSIRQLIEELTLKLAAEFSVGLDRINKEFQELFTLMFGGGSASLSVVREQKRRRSEEDLSVAGDDSGDDDDKDLVAGQEDQEEVEEGLEVVVSLPHKRVRGLDMLSGGERALTSIALLFSISRVNPPPFVILDETDAALDEANSRKYGNMIEGLAQSSQLILITHNRETMSRAGVLYGITMGSDGCSRLLSIKFEEAVAVAK